MIILLIYIDKRITRRIIMSNISKVTLIIMFFLFTMNVSAKRETLYDQWVEPYSIYTLISRVLRTPVLKGTPVEYTTLNEIVKRRVIKTDTCR